MTKKNNKGMEEKKTADEKMFCITLKGSQMRRLAWAADFASRVICGQTWDLQSVCEDAWQKSHDGRIGDKEWWDMRYELEEKLAEIKKLCWNLNTNANHGIRYDEMSDSLFDMRKSMELARYNALPIETQEAMRWTVMRDGPMGLDPDGEIKIEQIKQSEDEKD